jgi:Putative addiction module component
VALIKVASNATIVLMSRALEEVARQAIELSQEERLVLARILLEGCNLPGYPINEAEQTWEEEIANRIRAIDSGTAKARSWEDVVGDVDRRLAG